MDTALEPRILVLNMALNIEHQLSKTLLSLFRIKKDVTYTLSHKGGALTFKTKVDLLYDLDRINKDEYPFFQLFMEIRNQFIHNLDATTFDIVIKRINGAHNQGA